MRLLTLVATLCCFSVTAQVQKYAIVDATLHTMTEQGVLEGATILIDNGNITDIVTQAPKLDGYTVIEAHGQPVTPGLFGAYTSLGLVEVGMSAGTVDSRSEMTGLSTTGAALDVAYAINPFSSLMAVARVGGVTSAATGMSSSHQLFKGQGAVISLGSDYQPILRQAAFMPVSVDNSGADTIGGSRAVLWVTLEKVLNEAQLAKGKSFSPFDKWYGLSSIDDVQALQGVISGNTPLIIEAHRAADIMQVIALKERHTGIRPVILYATEGWRVAEQLAKANIPVILNPESNLPYEFDQLGATLRNAGRLHTAGVTVAIGMHTHNIRLARQHAGNAVANGLPWEAGLASLTVNPATIYGVDDRVGKVAKGMQADLVIWTGDPLEVTQDAQQVFIKGQPIKMESRQTKLRDRYLNRTPGKSVHYQHP